MWENYFVLNYACPKIPVYQSYLKAVSIHKTKLAKHHKPPRNFIKSTYQEDA